MSYSNITTAILLASGSGKRMGQNKLLMNLGGKTPLELSYEALAAAEIDEILITATDETAEYCKKLESDKPTRIVPGGRTRGHSVQNALKSCSKECGIVVIHDAARCLVTPTIINESIASAQKYGSGIAATQVRDTLRRKITGETVDREQLLIMQTPQTFRYAEILHAYTNFLPDSGTDDCDFYIRAGFEPHYLYTSFSNQKLTYPEDLELFSSIIKERRQAMGNVRIGYGEDTHRLTEGRRLVLGGVDIPFRLGLLGHSDADALCHAISDALLGACALGDIGKHFPDTDQAYRGISSIILLQSVYALLQKHGYRIVNIDSTIIAQEPKLAPHIIEMRQNIAEALQINMTQVSIKATTPEHTGPEGALECITARAVVMVGG